MKIIISLNLINKENLCDEEIFKEIDMESIIITKAMFKKLNSLLDNEEINFLTFNLPRLSRDIL